MVHPALGFLLAGAILLSAILLSAFWANPDDCVALDQSGLLVSFLLLIASTILAAGSSLWSLLRRRRPVLSVVAFLVVGTVWFVVGGVVWFGMVYCG